MYCNVVTIFPEMFGTLGYGITGRAQQRNLLKIECINPRDFATDAHKSVDDRPYGGGPGMVMKAEPLLAAINAAKVAMQNASGSLSANNSSQKPVVIYLSPQGKLLQQNMLHELLALGQVVFVAGRYEGIDERVCKLAIDDEWSIGDYVLSGGELAAMVVIDALARLIPGALGDEDSNLQDSFASPGLLDWPHYTRPAEIAGMKVPEVLLNGDHAAIGRWRVQQQIGRTWLRRPDLLASKHLSSNEELLLAEFKNSVVK